MIKQKILDRCAARSAEVETLADGTLVVPSVADEPNRTVAAWMQYLGVGAESKMMIMSAEAGRCWVKYPGQTSVTAHG